MIIKEAILHAAQDLQSFPNNILEARVLLGHVLQMSQEELFLHYAREITELELRQFLDLIKRRAQYEPVAYLLGKKEFYSREFVVSKDVLIPRADTEILVEQVIKYYNDYFKNQPVRILELGTGSGAIAVSLALGIKNSSITAVDNSDAALLIASKNLEFHKVQRQVNLLKSNWYEKIVGKFDFIVSNPPYISRKETNYLSRETMLFEPENALFAENDGLANYQLIAAKSANFLHNNGAVFFEVGFKQAEAVRGILKLAGYGKTSIIQDLVGFDRVIIAANYESKNHSAGNNRTSERQSVKKEKLAIALKKNLVRRKGKMQGKAEINSV